MAACGSIPKSIMLSSTWAIAWGWTSLPGEPKTISSLPSFSARAGSRGQARPLAALDAGRVGLVDPGLAAARGRMRPSPGIIGVAPTPSLGVAEKPLPQLIHGRSSSWCPAPASVAAVAARSASRRPPGLRSNAHGSPGAGISAQARSIAMRSRQVAAYSLLSRPVHRHLHEVRIAVIGVAIGEGGVQRRDDQVEVLGRVVAERPQGVPLQDVQRLGQDRPLAPRPAGEHVVATVVGRAAGSIFDRELGEVVVVEEAAVLLVERDDLTGDVALVEQVASGAQAGLTVAGAGLGRDQPVERLRQIGC